MLPAKVEVTHFYGTNPRIRIWFRIHTKMSQIRNTDNILFDIQYIIVP